ncbi:hypothetical protein [Streptococcus respiraculi]
MTEKTCFVVTAIGTPGTPTHAHADKVLTYLIRPVCEELGYKVIRVDQESFTGNINESIINHLKTDELVIADMTEHNPNAFYELGYREALGLPLIPIIKYNEKLPFDVASNRTILYDTDVAEIENSKRALKEMVKSIGDFNMENIKKSKDKPESNLTTIEKKIDEILHKLNRGIAPTSSPVISKNLPELDHSIASSITSASNPLNTPERRQVATSLSQLVRKVSDNSTPKKK